jgi:hypothetical protein
MPSNFVTPILYDIALFINFILLKLFMSILLFKISYATGSGSKQIILLYLFALNNTVGPIQEPISIYVLLLS